MPEDAARRLAEIRADVEATEANHRMNEWVPRLSTKSGRFLLDRIDALTADLERAGEVYADVARQSTERIDALTADVARLREGNDLLVASVAEATTKWGEYEEQVDALTAERDALKALLDENYYRGST